MNDKALKTEVVAQGADTERPFAAMASDAVPARQKKSVILIAGMHRSGTSALARMFSLLGCDLPKTLLPAGPGNDPGHWESWPILTLNDEILASAGSSWDDWEAFNPAWHDSPVKDGFVERMLRTLEEEFCASRFFVLNDPRTCRLLPFWIEVLEAFGATPHVVCLVHHPMEVAVPLESRDGIDPSAGPLLWLRHVLDAEVHSRGLRRAFLRYEAMLAGWHGLPDRLCGDLGIAWPRRSSTVNIEIGGLLLPAHRRQARPAAAVLGDPGLSRWIGSSFEILDRWARGDVRAGDRDELDRIRAAFDEAAPTFAQPVLAGRQAARRNAALDAELAQRDIELSQALGRIGELAGVTAAREAALAQREAEIEGLREAFAAGEATLAQRDAEIEGLREAVAAGEATLAQRDAEIAGLREAAAAREAALAQRDTEIAGLREAVAAGEAALAQRDAAIAGLRELTVNQTSEVERLVRLLKAFESNLNAVHASTCWRVTGPLRAARRGAAHLTVALRSFLSALAVRLRFHATTYALLQASHAVRRGSLAPLRNWRSTGAVAHSDLFDRNWYVEMYPDVAAAEIDPVRHYLAYGADEGRDPGPAFSTRDYLLLNPDVAAAGLNPLVHYLRAGRAERRQLHVPVPLPPSPVAAASDDLDLLAGLSPKRVSVIVPNYNYLRYLEARLGSVSAQTVAPYEVIVLDDASTDGSGDWLRDNLGLAFPSAVFVENERNSGSAFVQWLNGVRRARGDYVWIAEADDLAEPGFLAETLRAFDNPDVVLSYCQSKQIDEDGGILRNDYLDYVADISPSKWMTSYVNDGHEEIVTALSVKNTIPNVSGVVFRRDALLAALETAVDDLKSFRVAGDWLVYIEVLRRGKIAFSPRPFNLHRRHPKSVTIGQFDLSQLSEIVRAQTKVREAFAPPERYREMALNYVERVYEQFGLRTDKEPNARTHPELSQLFGDDRSGGPGIASPSIVSSWRGVCPICSRPARFAASNSWFRDHLICETCPGGSIPRERALFKVLTEIAPDWRHLSIHESSPGNRGVSLALQKECRNYTPTHYFRGVSSGAFVDGVQCQDLECQTFRDSSFDLVITQDVMEHVFNPDRAFREIARTLKPTGIHLLTTPVYKDRLSSQICARKNLDGSIDYLEPPEYHGNPVDPDGSLVTIKYGYDVADLVEKWSDMDVEVRRFRDRTHGIIAEFTEVIICRKRDSGWSNQPIDLIG